MVRFVANTDFEWFQFLGEGAAAGVVDEVNFWSPNATRPMKKMSPREPIFFRLKAPRRVIAGYGFFATFHVVSLDDAWDLFG